jgi:hypothetical protein
MNCHHCGHTDCVDALTKNMHNDERIKRDQEIEHNRRPFDQLKGIMTGCPASEYTHIVKEIASPQALLTIRLTIALTKRPEEERLVAIVGVSNEGDTILIDYNQLLPLIRNANGNCNDVTRIAFANAIAAKSATAQKLLMAIH